MEIKNMKKAYVKPLMESEAFVPDEYVAVCLTLYCAIPGRSPYVCHDGTTTRVGEDGLDHGAPCANGSYYNPERQYEMEQPGSKVYSVFVNGISIDANTNYSQFKEGVEYPATWISDNGLQYKHRGVATVDQTSNHS